MTQHLRRGLGLSRAREPDPEQRRLHHHAARACARSSCCAIRRAKSARCTTAAPIAAPRCAARRRARRASSPARITAGAISTPASCARCRGRTAMPATSRIRKFNVAQVPRVDSYRGFIFGTLNPDAPPLLDYLGGITGPIDEWLDRQPGRQGRGVRGQPAQIQGQLEARLRQFRRRLSRRVLAPLAAGDGEPACRRGQQGHVLLQGLAGFEGRCTWPIWATATTSRTSGRTSTSAPAACGRSKGRAPGHRALRGGAAPPLRRQGRGHPRSRLLGAGQHQRVPEPLAARQPHPGVRAGVGRRDQRHLVRHRGGGRGRARSAARSTRSTRCACARRSSSRISARSTTSPISRRSSAGSPAWRTNGSTCTAGSASPAASRPTPTASSPRPRPTRPSCANTSTSGSG